MPTLRFIIDAELLRELGERLVGKTAYCIGRAG